MLPNDSCTAWQQSWQPLRQDAANGICIRIHQFIVEAKFAYFSPFSLEAACSWLEVVSLMQDISTQDLPKEVEAQERSVMIERETSGFPMKWMLM